MICPKCGEESIGVIDTRPTISGNGIRRRRKCEECGYRFTTYEQTRSDLLTTAKQLLQYELQESINTAINIVFKKNNGENTSKKHRDKERFVL